MKLLNDWREANKLIDDTVDPAYIWIARGAFLAGVGAAGLFQLFLGLPPLLFCVLGVSAGVIGVGWGLLKMARAAIAKAEGRKAQS